MTMQLLGRCFAERYDHNSLRHSMLLVTCLLLSCLLLATGARANERTVTKIADGVYLIVHKNAPDHFPQGNSVVIIGDGGVLVVDSCYLPSSAREDIADIRRWTNKPVRYLLNTHWHNDHDQGNAVYAEAFPTISIIAHTETAKQIALRVGAFLSQYPHRLEVFQHQLDTGKDSDGNALTQEQIEDLRNAVAGGKAATDAVSAEFRGLNVRVPDLTFDQELDLDLGNRTVQLKFLGRGNTAGDVVAYLPKERIIIAGDLVDSPVPFLGGGFPIEQIATLERMEALDFDTLLPGHGSALSGKTFLRQEITLIEAVVAAMNHEIGRSMEGPQRRFNDIRKAVEQNVDRNAWRQKFAGDDPNERDFFDVFTWPGLIEAAHAEMWPR